MEKTSPNLKFKKNNVSTWDNLNWSKLGSHTQGTVSNKPIFSDIALENRQNKNIYDIYKNILNTDDLIVSHDTYLFYRPSKSIRMGRQIVNKPEWKSNYKNNKNQTFDFNNFNPSHFISEANNTTYQGLIVLTNNSKKDGCFTINIEKELEELEELEGLGESKELEESEKSEKNGEFIYDIETKSYKFKIINENENKNKNENENKNKNKNKNENKNKVSIVVNQGSMIVWNRDLDYEILSNNSDRSFCAQFISMFENNKDINRKKMVRTMIKQNSKTKKFIYM
jgi:hypothetical protein